jgi:hypothetical protein|tara:strand:+ start:30 stop:266 length:237 start_codon:yes stop_codon:yes gene_type:complete
MNEETPKALTTTTQMMDEILRLNKESSNYESLLHIEQKKNKVFFDTIKSIPIKHYEQEQYVDLLESIRNNIFKEEIDA